MYTALYIIFMFIAVPYLKIKSLIRGYDFSLKERFVFYKDLKKRSLWIHCASVGELNTVKPIYNYFKKEYEIVITVSSPRGKKYAEKIYKEAVIRELPFDIPFLIKKFIKMYNPAGFIIVEGELWFNTIKTSSKLIPVISVNARISPKSFNFYKKFSFLFKKLFSFFTLIIARSEKDAEIIKYFTYKAKIVICGDLKLVSSKIKEPFNISLPKDKKVLVAGSTYKIEEEMLLDTVKQINKKILLILAPRHLERLKEVIEEVKKRNLKYCLLSKCGENKDIDVIIVDKMGILPSLYKYADAAFVGGTIENIGGHNILEAIVENKPVIIGENYFKIKPLIEEFKEYIYVVSSKEDLKNAINDLVDLKNLKINIDDKINRVFECYIKNIKKVIK